MRRIDLTMCGVVERRQHAKADLRLLSYRPALPSLTMAPGISTAGNKSMGKQRSRGEAGINLIERLWGNGRDELSAAAADDLLAISGLAQKEIEQLVAEAYRGRGYLVELTACGAQPDGGMLLTKATQRLLLQCKYWRTRKIAEMPVRELYGMMAAHDANAGILITSGSFTLEASRFAGYGSIQLIDGPRLLALLRDNEAAQPSGGRAPRVSSAR
jgi:restriction endonuclease Mrr